MSTLPRLAQACLLAGGFLLAVGTAPRARAATEYPLGADSKPQEGVPRGRWVEGQFRAGDDSLFPGTTRPYALYVPAQYDRKSPAAVMVFQDGKGMADTWRVGPVFDNLIHRKELPVILGVFVAPGVVPPLSTNELARFNRSFEYDSLGDRYARFLTAEFLPFVERTHEVRFTTEPAGRAIAGASSGGIAAFNAAWEQPGAFSRVFCTIGTFVGLRGGNAFPVLVRKTEPKALRIFLQDGSSDLDIYGGNWWIANQDMLSALEFAGYEVNHAWGDGGHDGKHGAAVFPEAMRWLWRDHPKPVASAKPSRNTFLQQILLPGETWTVASQGHTGVSSPVAGRDGEVFFADGAAGRIHRIDPAGKVTEFARDTGGAQALAFGADGRLYALGQNTGKVLRFDATGRAEVVAG
jgi:gluconolactonase